jgi:hypothetical protein
MALGLAAAFAIFRRYDERYYVTYLMLSYAYFALNRGGKPDGLEARSKEFTERIAVSLAREDVDEVLIVGHSAGAGIGVRICAELLRQGRVPPGKLALLGIGSVTQVVSFLPRARWMRADLRMLAAAEDFTWVEVSAPSDGLCFAMSDPVATTGVDVPSEQKRWPVVFSAAFHNSLSEELRNSPEFTHFRKHFQYIHAFDRPRDYDYFQITAGPLRLADRYGDRPHSPSRVVRAVGPYRDY